MVKVKVTLPKVQNQDKKRMLNQEKNKKREKDKQLQSPEVWSLNYSRNYGIPTDEKTGAPAAPAVVTPEMKEMRERRRQSRFKSDEINAKITLDQLKDEDGQPRFSSGRFGAVFLLPESCQIQKIQGIKDEEDDVQSQSD
ncbi:unnamed protein product [Haemonchus placei]|uniref:Regulator of nonsense transcripts 2 n=1 Tax=Haemonchus placei TaxID=6290 RepID=A0A0N4VWZ7_HAEPC|nr:unnamed protein product [Haemonchus placei]